MPSLPRKQRLAEQRRAGDAYQRQVRSREISEAVLAERDRALHLAAPTLTALIMGDPLPGRSALDKKMQQAAFVRNRVLDEIGALAKP